MSREKDSRIQDLLHQLKEVQESQIMPNTIESAPKSVKRPDSATSKQDGKQASANFEFEAAKLTEAL